jgi:sigma54-dependent transcription regulator
MALIRRRAIKGNIESDNAATNRDLAAAIASESFRADLFHRLNVFPIDVPPLQINSRVGPRR